MITLSLTEQEVDLLRRAAEKDGSLAVLAMKLVAFQAGKIPDSEGVIERASIPEAHSISYGTCGNDTCSHLHLILYNPRSEPIATAACDERMLNNMLYVLRGRD